MSALYAFRTSIATIRLVLADSREEICGHFIIRFAQADAPPHSMYICAGKVPVSYDGEYRTEVFAPPHFNQIMSASFWDDADEMFTEFIARANIEVAFRFPPDETAHTRKIVRNIVIRGKYDYKIALYHFFLLVEASSGIVASARVPSITYQLIAKDLPQIHERYREMQHNYRERGLILSEKLALREPFRGLKIVPITRNELQHAYDIRYKLWREVHVQRVLSASASVPSLCFDSLFTKYLPEFIIHDVDETLFANPNIVARIRRATRAREIRALISAINSDNDAPAGADSRVETARQMDMNLELLDYESGNIEFADAALCMISVMRSADFGSIAPNLAPQQISDLLFSWSVAFLCLHEFAGVIHADAHIHNLHVQRDAPPFALALDGRVYQIQESGTRGFLLDFSRAIANPYNPSVAQHSATSREVLCAEQGTLLARFFAATYPKSERMREVAEIIARDYARAFRILSILDVIYALKNLCEYLPSLRKPGQIDRALRYLDRCETFLASALDKPGDVPDAFPMRALIAQEFEDYSRAALPIPISLDLDNAHISFVGTHHATENADAAPPQI